MSRQVVIAAALIVWVTSLTHAQGARTVRDGVYTDAQAARGQAIYQKQCVSCHGAKLEGLQGPPLIADVFVNQATQPLSDLAWQDPQHHARRCDRHADAAAVGRSRRVHPEVGRLPRWARPIWPLTRRRWARSPGRAGLVAAASPGQARVYRRSATWRS